MQLKGKDKHNPELQKVNAIYNGMRVMYFVLVQLMYLAFMAFCLPVVTTGSLYVTYTVGFISAAGLVYWELTLLLNYHLRRLKDAIEVRAKKKAKDEDELKSATKTGEQS